MQYFVHGDIETGGLDGRIEGNKLGMLHYPIFELAFIVTDLELNQVGEPLRLVIHQSEAEIAKCHEWALKAHTKSGLLDEVRASALTLKEAEQVIISHLKALGINKYDRKEKTGAVFSGNSIKLDRNFLTCQMPELNDYFHYRQLDISVLALAARAFIPELEKDITSRKEFKHEALADIQESIKELKAYRSTVFMKW